MAKKKKKEYKEFYLPPQKPVLVKVPKMNYIAVRGKGDPNAEDGEYKQSISVLYALAYTVKMSKKGSREIEGYFDFVVPPLEGLWRQEGVAGVDYSRKDKFEFISMIRLPDFVTLSDFEWAREEAAKKKKLDTSKAEFFTYDEGLCVQCMHIGSFDDEPATVALMQDFIAAEGYETDLDGGRLHHEIYLSDARKTEPAKLKMVIRHPVRKA